MQKYFHSSIIVLLLFVVAFSTATSHRVKAQVSEQDSLALLDLTASFFFVPSTSNLFNWWHVGGPVRTWKGVTLENGRVTAIDLSDNGLGGAVLRLPTTLTRLEKIDFSNNRLRGNILPDFASFPSLKSLDLSNNSFSGEIPLVLTRIDSLRFLNLSNNELSGPIPDSLSRLTRLVELDLSHNMLSGGIPESLGDLSQLEVLKLSGNWLPSTIPADIARLQELRILDLRDLGLTGKIPAFVWDFLQLEELYLSGYTPERAPFPEKIGQLKNLVKLDLSGVFKGEINDSIVELQKLKELYLCGSRGLSGDLALLGLLPNLEILCIWHTGFSDEIPETFGNLVNLKELNLKGTDVRGEIPPELGSMESLESLILYGLDLVGSIPETLGNLENLIHLDLTRNNLSGEIPASIGRLKNLNRLALERNQLTGNIPPEIGEMTNLIWIIVSWNNLSGTLPITLTGLGNLIWFQFNDTSLCIPNDPTFLGWLKGVSYQDAGCYDASTKEPDTEEPDAEIVTSSLEAVYPNPILFQTTIHYSLADPSDVSLAIFDLLGKRVRSLENGFRTGGEHAVTFDATGLPSGVYFYTLTAGEISQTRKMVLLR